MQYTLCIRLCHSPFCSLPFQVLWTSKHIKGASFHRLDFLQSFYRFFLRAFGMLQYLLIQMHYV